MQHDSPDRSSTWVEQGEILSTSTHGYERQVDSLLQTKRQLPIVKPYAHDM